ncbi:hypothetical protein [Reichenbachiella sp. MALMAid0571]|uniref:hypothetical protein n=1 Tax=Reichenbachiella sp. MALMAid0571 TaxID=3143939 RepID=UPI0032DE3478
MRKSTYKLLLLVTIFILSNQSIAKERDDVERRKKIEKSYTVGTQHILDITNKFGRVHVNTWNKSQIDVKIEVIARGKNEERAQNILDQIDISISDSGNLIKFITELKGNMNNKNSETFEINYLVNMPMSNSLKLKNSFGETYLADFSGNLDLDVSYGELKADKLTGQSEVKISFGDGEIDLMKSGELTIKYSDVEVEELGNVKFEQGYSDVSIERANSLDLICKYGDVSIGELVNVVGSVDFSEFTVDKLYNSMELETSYSGGFKVTEVSKDFKKIHLKGKFGSFKIGFEKGTNATVDASLKFCELNYSGIDLDFSYKVKEDFKSEYKGKMGNGTGGEISVTSSYGDVKFYQF